MSVAPSISPIPFYAGVQSSNAMDLRHFPVTGAVRKFAQGAGSALLVFSGADAMTGNANAAAAGSPPVVDFASLDGLLQTLISGGLNGPLQFGAAALLFLAAGRCVARFLGLIAAAAITVLYLQGVTIEDAWVYMREFTTRLAAAASAFQTADIS